MKRIYFTLTTIACTVALLLHSMPISSQTVNSLYFLEKTPFHTKWNPAMAPSRSGIGGPFSSFGITFRSDLVFSDVFYPSADGNSLLSILHPDLPQSDKDAFLTKMGDAANFGVNTNLDFFNIGLKLGGAYFTLGSSMSTDIGMGLPKDFFELFLNGTGSGASNTLNMAALNINAMSYLKTGVGLSLKVGNKLTVGGTVNYLMGIADMRLGFDKFNINTSNTSWEIETQGNLRVIAPDFVQLKYNADGYLDFENVGEMVDDSYFSSFASNIQSDFKGTLPTAGTGLSVDLGVTFKPMNFLTVSAAVLDYGSIKWKPENINQATSNSTFTYNGSDLSGDSNSDFSSQLVDMMHLEKVANPEAYSSKLTTKINLGAELGLLPKNRISLGVLSQTGIAENGNYQDFMFSANLKPISLIQTALTYSMLHGGMSAIGAALNIKLLFLNIYAAADYIPMKVTPQYIPINNGYFNFQTGFNLMF